MRLAQKFWYSGKWKWTSGICISGMKNQNMNTLQIYDFPESNKFLWHENELICIIAIFLVFHWNCNKMFRNYAQKWNWECSGMENKSLIYSFSRNLKVSKVLKTNWGDRWVFFLLWFTTNSNFSIFSLIYCANFAYLWHTFFVLMSNKLALAISKSSFIFPHKSITIIRMRTYFCAPQFRMSFSAKSVQSEQKEVELKKKLDMNNIDQSCQSNHTLNS